MNIKEYYSKKGISEEELIKLFSKKVIKKKLPFNNLAVNGYEIKKELANRVSVSKPKFWPERGYYEF